MKISTPAIIVSEKTSIISELSDVMNFKKIEERKIKISKIKGFKIPTNDENPVFRAAILIQKMKPNKLGVDIQIEKNIPVSSGLNSMYGNAAGTILALNKLWDFRLSEKQMSALGKKISPNISDILKKHFTAEKTETKYLVIIKPKYIEIDRAWIKKAKSSKKNIEKIITSHFPDIAKIIKALLEYGCKKSGISGNGPSVFGISDMPLDEEKIIKHLKDKTEFVWFGKSCNNWGKLLD